MPKVVSLAQVIKAFQRGDRACPIYTMNPADFNHILPLLRIRRDWHPNLEVDTIAVMGNLLLPRGRTLEVHVHKDMTQGCYEGSNEPWGPDPMWDNLTNCYPLIETCVPNYEVVRKKAGLLAEGIKWEDTHEILWVLRSSLVSMIRDHEIQSAKEAVTLDILDCDCTLAQSYRVMDELHRVLLERHDECQS